MKRVLTVIFAVLLFASMMNAQKGKLKGGASVVVAFPQTSTNMGFGFSGVFFYGINNLIDLTGSIGYTVWGYSDVDANLTTIPVLLGGRYKFSELGGFIPYALAEIGLHFMTVSVEVPGIPGFTETYTGSASTNEFGIAVGGGGYFQLGDITLDCNLQYNYAQSGYLASKLGIVFNL